MKVVFVSSEVTPFASSGGLGEVAAALPKALARAGDEVCRVMPLYGKVLAGGHRLTDLKITLNIPVGFRTLRAEVFTSDELEARTYFIRRDEFFDRSQLYGLADRDYDDNFERFVFFQKAVVALIDRLELKADIVHCNDWQTGLVPYFLKYGLQGGGRVMREKTVFTIHNLAYQGCFPGSDFTMTNLPLSCFSMRTMEYYGSINCMKAGLTGADHITTVSETYAKEIQSPEAGCGLEGVIAERRSRLSGILNGIDAEVWDPATDSHLAAHFSATNLLGKQSCREHLCEAMKVKQSPQTPIIGMVTRLVDQKGVDILAAAMPELMKRELSFVLLGTGSEAYEKLAGDWMRMWPGKFGRRIGFDPKLAHRIFSGSDIFLMPSRFEPCGLNQLYALRYGTIPVVHRVGGLADTVVDARENPTGYGYSFADYSADALVATVGAALKDFSKRSRWQELMSNAMAQDFSWDRSSAKYRALFASLTA